MNPDQINAMFDATENARLAREEREMRADQTAAAVYATCEGCGRTLDPDESVTCDRCGYWAEGGA